MGLLSTVLEGLFGRTKVVVFSNNVAAVEITVEGRVITAEVKNLVTASGIALSEFIKLLAEGRSSDPLPNIVGRLKSLGYKIKVKYGRLEVEV